MTPLETAVRALLADVAPVEATSATAVVPVRAELLAELARALGEGWECAAAGCGAYNAAGAAGCGICGVGR